MNINHYFSNHRIYNGTNHELNMYDPQDTYMDREGKYYLKLASSIPKSIIERGIALSVQYGINSDNNTVINSLHYYQPNRSYTYLDTLPNFKEYDTIVVSSKYAKIARKRCFQNDPDYLDRLFTPISIYNKEDNKVIGAIGFQKVCDNRNIIDYCQMVDSHLRLCSAPPSLSAIASAVDYYSNFSYIDPTTLSYINYLKDYLYRKQYNI